MASGSRIKLEVDVFHLLIQRGVHLNSHVENSLKFCGYSHAWTLATFDREIGIEEVEECVRKNLAKPTRFDRMTNVERRATFGDYFADDPTDFNFFSGDRQAIRMAVDTAIKIVGEWDSRKRKSSSVVASDGKRARQSNEVSSSISPTQPSVVSQPPQTVTNPCVTTSSST